MVGDIWWWVTILVLLREWSVTLLRLSVLKHVVIAAAQSGGQDHARRSPWPPCACPCARSTARSTPSGTCSSRSRCRCGRRRDDALVGVRVLPRRAGRGAAYTSSHKSFVRFRQKMRSPVIRRVRWRATAVVLDRRPGAVADSFVARGAATSNSGIPPFGSGAIYMSLRNAQSSACHWPSQQRLLCPPASANAGHRPRHGEVLEQAATAERCTTPTSSRSSTRPGSLDSPACRSSTAARPTGTGLRRQRSVAAGDTYLVQMSTPARAAPHTRTPPPPGFRDERQRRSGTARQGDHRAPSGSGDLAGNAALVDMVGYGDGATSFEGAPTGVDLTATTSAKRFETWRSTTTRGLHRDCLSPGTIPDDPDAARSPRSRAPATRARSSVTSSSPRASSPPATPTAATTASTSRPATAPTPRAPRTRSSSTPRAPRTRRPRSAPR